jgi:Uma2 family endonuclease
MARAFEAVAQRRFTVEEYHRMAEAGILGPDERVELVRGVILKKARKSRGHVIATSLVSKLLDEALRGRASVYQGAPIVLDSLDSEPEPDLLVCSNPDMWAYGTARTRPLLVVEVADASLGLDLGEKASLYAEAGVPEYWVVNLVERLLVVFRDPVDGIYEVRLSLDETSRVTPISWPELAFEVSAFFPPLAAIAPDR